MMVAGRLEAGRHARGELLELCAAVEIGAGAEERHASAAKFRRAATKVGLPKDVRLTLVPGVSTARRDAELVADVVSEVGEYRIGDGVHGGIGKGGHRVRQSDV